MIRRCSKRLLLLRYGRIVLLTLISRRQSVVLCLSPSIQVSQSRAPEELWQSDIFGNSALANDNFSRQSEHLLSFDTKSFPFRELVADALEVEDVSELDKLHLYEPEDFALAGKIRASLSSSRTPLKRVELLRRALTERWKMSPQKRTWEKEYLPCLVREVVGPGEMPDETMLVYQRAPMLRFHVAWPLEDGEQYDYTVPPKTGRNPGTLAAVHTDGGKYGHPTGEVNFLLPMTCVGGTNSLFVEGFPERGDFEPFSIRYGEMMVWNGNDHRHCSPRNISDKTRVSFDFRVIPGSKWEKPDNKSSFQLGTYYLDALRGMQGSEY